MNLHDGLNMANPATTARNAYRVIDAVQTLPPAEQVHATLMAAMAMCRVLGLDAREVMMKSGRVLEDAVTAQTHEARALVEYVAEEIGK